MSRVAVLYVYHDRPAMCASRLRLLRALEEEGEKNRASAVTVKVASDIALYALNASLRYLESIGVANIAAHADPLVAGAETALRALGVTPMCRWNGSGIVARRWASAMRRGMLAARFD